MADKQKTADLELYKEDDAEDEAEDEQELDTAIDMSLAVLPLEVAEQKLMLKIIEAPTKEDLQYQLELFNINQSKKNAMRIVKLTNLQNKVEDQAIERLETRPDQISNRELLEYITVISGQIDRAQKAIDSVKDAPAITINNQKNELNINLGAQLDRDSKEKVMDVIAALLKQVKKEPEIGDVDFVEPADEADIITIEDDNTNK